MIYSIPPKQSETILSDDLDLLNFTRSNANVKGHTNVLSLMYQPVYKTTTPIFNVNFFSGNSLCVTKLSDIDKPVIWKKT